MIWLADSSFAPHSQVGVDAIPHLCITARKMPTPVLSLLSLTQAGFGSIIPSGLLLTFQTSYWCGRQTQSIQHLKHTQNF